MSPYPLFSAFTLQRIAEDLRASGASEHAFQAYIFGTSATLLHVATHQGTLPLYAADVAWSATEFALNEPSTPDDPALSDVNEDYLGRCGPWHADLQKGATLISREPGAAVEVWLPAVEHLVLSKFFHLTENDMPEIFALMQTPGASWELVAELARDIDGWSPAPWDEVVGLTAQLDYVMRRHREATAQTGLF